MTWDQIRELRDSGLELRINKMKKLIIFLMAYTLEDILGVMSILSI